MNILILGFLLPALIVILVRLIFGYYVPMSIGFYFSDNANRTPFEADVHSVGKFCLLNNALFMFGFAFLSGLFILPTVSYLYSYEIIMQYFNTTAILAIVFYVVWFLSMVAAGYIYGRGFFDTIRNSDAKGKFYYETLCDCYFLLVDSPSKLLNSLSLFFDNEQKIQKRIALHKKLAREYAQAGEKKFSGYLKKAVKENTNLICKLKKIRSTKGTLGVFVFNLATHWDHVVFFPIVPALTFYLILIGLFANLIPSLKKANDFIIS